MLKRSLATLAVLAMASWGGSLRAQDTQRLSQDADAPTITLGGTDDQADTDLVYYRGGSRGGHYGGSRGGYYGGSRGGYYGGSRGGYYGGYRGYYGGYRGYYGHNHYYRPYYGARYYSYYPSYYYPSYTYYQPYCYSYPSYYTTPAYYGDYCAISVTSPQLVQAAPLGALPQIPQVAPYQGSQPYTPAPVMPRAPVAADQDNGTFNYDGGPGSAVPLPGSEPPLPGNNYLPPSPTGNPLPAKATPDGRLVSVPGQVQKAAYTFRAYGESSPTTTPASQSGITTPVSLPGTGFAFPAYGEQPRSTSFASKR